MRDVQSRKVLDERVISVVAIRGGRGRGVGSRPRNRWTARWFACRSRGSNVQVSVSFSASRLADVITGALENGFKELGLGLRRTRVTGRPTF